MGFFFFFFKCPKRVLVRDVSTFSFLKVKERKTKWYFIYTLARIAANRIGIKQIFFLFFIYTHGGGYTRVFKT